MIGNKEKNNKIYDNKNRIGIKVKSEILSGDTMGDHNKNPRYYGNTSGIYKITNDRTGETYIGQSKNIERRIKDHKKELRQGTHHNKGMQSDYLKGDTFTSTILEKTSSDRQTLHQKEEKYISQYDTFNQGYNQTPGGQYDKYKGHYGHGGGRLGSSRQQTSSSKQNNNYTKNHGNNIGYSGGTDEFNKFCLFVVLILFGPLIFFNILFNTQFINLADGSIDYSAFIPLILFVIIVIILLMYIFSNNKINNSKNKGKTPKLKAKSNRKYCTECGQRLPFSAKECFRCSSTTFTDKPTHTIMYDKTREIAIDPELHKRQKELARKYNKKNYKKIIKNK